MLARTENTHRSNQQKILPLILIFSQHLKCFRTSPKALFDLILYVPANNFSVTSGRVFLGWNSTKQLTMWLAQGHNAVTPVRPEPAALQSRVKHSTTEPLHPLSPKRIMIFLFLRYKNLPLQYKIFKRF